MSKILIIDERMERKKILMRESDLSMLYDFEQEGVLCILSSLPFSSKSPINELDTAFADYSIVAIHRTLMQTENVMNIIDEYFRNSKKPFIIFSGGTSVNDFSNNSLRLSVNARDFYSSRLIGFIEKLKNGTTPTLLELLYGEFWRLPLLLEYRNLLWRDRMSDEDDEYDMREEELRQAIQPSQRVKLDVDWVDKEIEKEKLKFCAI